MVARPIEPVLSPSRRIIDPHHHLWPPRPDHPYLLADLDEDTGSGHRVVATVFIECMASFRTTGPEHLACIGETEFVARLAEQSRKRPGPVIAGIVGAADLRLGARLDEVLAAHLDAGQGLFRGIRHAAAWDRSDAIRPSHHNPPPELYLDAGFRAGFARLAPAGLSFDAWLFHPQIPELTDLARAFPETPIVLDHFGGPLGIGPYSSDRKEVFQTWHRNMTRLAACPNVFIKLGGMAMPINGYGWHRNPGFSLSSKAFVEAQGDYYRAAIDLFGPGRSMFESNFPVDKVSLSYRVLWNAFKIVATGFTEDEQAAMFFSTAAEFYRLALQDL